MGLKGKQAEKILQKAGLAPTKTSKAPKYNVSAKEARTVGDIVFDSKLEARMYLELKKVVPHNQLHLQPEFILQEGFRDRHGKKHRPIVYKADFLLGSPRVDFTAPLDDNQVVIDTKGMRTPVYRIKRKMLARCYDPLHFYEVRNLKELAQILEIWATLQTT